MFYGSGGASLFRARMLEEVGLFDEDHFAYLEDQDLGFRARVGGWKARYEPSAVAYHRMMGTSGGSAIAGAITAIRDCIYLYVKNLLAPLFWHYLPKFVLGVLLMAANDVRRRRFRAIAGPYVDAAVHLPRMVGERPRVQAGRRVAVGYRDSIMVHSLPPTQQTLLRMANVVRWRR